MTDDAPTETIELTLEESGWLMHMMMRSAMEGNTRNPIIDPVNNVERRMKALYHKLHQVNHKLMYADE